MTVPEHAGLICLSVLGVAGIATAVAGLVLVVRAGLALKARLEAYADLPLRIDIELARRRIALAERRIDTVPVLLARAGGAYRQIDVARGRIATMAATVVRVVRRPLGARERT